MDGAMAKKADWKSKIHQEITEYLANFIYLAFFFGLFTWYRRIILTEYRITYLHYGVSLFEALVLAKVVMLGGALSLGRRFLGRPLIVRTLYMAFVFSVWTAVFGVFEHTVFGLVLGKGLAWGIGQVKGNGGYELLARCLITFCAFVPFFAFKELSRMLGEDKIGAIFFRKS